MTVQQTLEWCIFILLEVICIDFKSTLWNQASQRKRHCDGHKVFLAPRISALKYQYPHRYPIVVSDLP